MAAPSQRRALGTLFAFLCVAFAGIAYAAGVSGAGVRAWIVAAAAAVIALWFASLAVQLLRRN